MIVLVLKNCDKMAMLHKSNIFVLVLSSLTKQILYFFFIFKKKLLNKIKWCVFFNEYKHFKRLVWIVDNI